MDWNRRLEHPSFVLVLIALWALAYLPNLGARSLRLEEGRRATPAREMLASGDFIRPTLYGDTYLNKPPLYFWLVAATGALLGEVSPLAVRLPSALAALGCALVAFRFAPDRLDRRTRALAGLLVLASATLLDKGTLGEIDATLCFVMAATLKCWWDGQATGRPSVRCWIAVGLLLGIAGLLKGPAGPAIFYMTVVPFVIWHGPWRQLLSAGHLVCLMLALIPSGLWVAALLRRSVVRTTELANIWLHQLGADHADTGPDFLEHYTTFPLQVVGMLFPAALWIPLSFGRRWCSAPVDVQRFLICGVVVPCIVIYLYPASRPRHLMPIFIPGAILAATTVIGLTRPGVTIGALLNRLGLLLGLFPVVIGITGLALAARVHPDGMPAAALGAAVTAAWSARSVWATRRTDSRDGALTHSVTLAGAMLAVWFTYQVVIVPWSAPSSPVRTALRCVNEKWNRAEPVYTTRTFPGNEGVYFNLQFHLATDVRAVDDLEELRLFTPCVAVVTVEERASLDAMGWVVEEVGRLHAPRGPPEVHLVRLRLPSGIQLVTNVID